jgi:transposase
VPYRLARQAVEVRATASVVEVFHRGRRVASHVHDYGRKRFLTKPAHMPAAHRAHLEWTPSRLVAWGASIGPPVAELMETILATRPHPEHGYRACLGLMHLVKRYDRERVAAACHRALARRGPAYRSGDASF